MKLLALLFALTIAGRAQNAKVISLSAEDAAKAAHLYDERDRIEREIMEMTGNITLKYLMVDPKDSLHQIKQGWSQFEFSEDFKYIVPKPYIASPCGCGGSIFLSNCATFTTTPVNSGTAVKGW